MLDQGVKANVISYNSVVNACARKGVMKRTEMWIVKMREAGTPPNQ
jgi:pentatricopeptide repeat protein